MILDFNLRKNTNTEHLNSVLYSKRGSTRVHRAKPYKVLGAAQPLGPVLLQQALQQMPRRVGNVGFQLQRLVENVVIHLRCVSAVERGLRREERGRLATLSDTCCV